MCSNSSLLSGPSDWAFFRKIQAVPSFAPSLPTSKDSNDRFADLENMFQKWFAEDDDSNYRCVNSKKPGSSYNPRDKQVKLLEQLLKDQEKLAKFPNFCPKLEKMLKQEISRVWEELNTKEEKAKEEEKVVRLEEKIFVPENVRDDFVGHLLGIGGKKIKQLSRSLGVSISIRGQGGSKGPVSEAKFKKQLYWGHFDDKFHVVIKCKGKERLCKEKIAKAVEVVKKIMVQPIVIEPKRTLITGKYLVDPSIGTFGTSKRSGPLVTLRFVE